MKADPAAQLTLLDLQSVDTAIAQLRHRRATLPEIAQLARCAERARLLQTRAAEVQVRADELDDAQRRLEQDVDTVRTRTTRDNERLTAGGMPGKELERLQHEIESLGRRQSGLEDELLELMEQREGVEEELGLARRDRGEIDDEVSRLTTSRDAAFATIDADLAHRTADRGSVAAKLPADLLALYEKIAASNGGVGAAEVAHRRCEGCRIDFAGSELAKIRDAAPDDVVRCENCRRILIRTERSGL
ncbi:zinc ribbon domain-containing protein [Jatrophihabitans sp. YIM 134969]